MKIQHRIDLYRNPSLNCLISRLSMIETEHAKSQDEAVVPFGTI